MRTLTLALGLLLAAPALAAPAAPCDAPALRADLDDALGTAEIAVAALDVDALRSAVERADRALTCLTEPVDTSAVARWYRVRGIHAFVAQDEAAAHAAFRSARALEPAYQLDPSLGAPIRAAWDAAVPPREAWTVALPIPAEGWVQVDGRRSPTAPAGRGYLLQWFDAAGAVRFTAPIAEGATAAPYPVADEPVGRPADPAPVTRDGRPSRGLLVTGLAALAAGGASIGASAAMQSAFLGGDQTSAERPGLVAGNQVLGIGGAVVGAVGVGAVVGAVVVGRW